MLAVRLFATIETTSLSLLLGLPAVASVTLPAAKGVMMVTARAGQVSAETGVATAAKAQQATPATAILRLIFKGYTSSYYDWSVGRA